MIVAQLFSPNDVCPKDGLLILSSNSEIVNGVIQTTYESGQTKSLHTIENGLLSGKSFWYYDSGAIKCEYSFQDGLLVGDFTIWYRNGQKKCYNKFTSGNQLQYWDWWDNNGIKIPFANQDSKWGIKSNYIPYSDHSYETMAGDLITFDYPEFIFSKYCGVESSVPISYFIDDKGFIREIRVHHDDPIISFNEAIYLTLLSNNYTPRILRDKPAGTWNSSIIKMNID